MKKQKKAFTLAETLITLTILGVVAAITVPMLINKQMEAANRTKVKKAMAAYEKALNQMIIENDVKSDIASAFTGCTETIKYFKPVENGDAACQFKTADRVWWDITKIERPIIAFEKADLTTVNAEDTTTKKAFYLLGYYDNGVLRINDLGAATDDNSGTPTTKNKTYLEKLYAFINPEKASLDSNNTPQYYSDPDPDITNYVTLANKYNQSCTNGKKDNCTETVCTDMIEETCFVYGKRVYNSKGKLVLSCNSTGDPNDCSSDSPSQWNSDSVGIYKYKEDATGTLDFKCLSCSGDYTSGIGTLTKKDSSGNELYNIMDCNASYECTGDCVAADKANCENAGYGKSCSQKYKEYDNEMFYCEKN